MSKKKMLRRLTRLGYLTRLFCLCIPWLLLWGYVELGFMSLHSAVTLQTPLRIGLRIYGVACMALYIYWSIRRQHDFNEPGWKVLYLLIPVFNLVWVIVLFTTAGTIGRNKYGHDPLHRIPVYDTGFAPKRGK
ncbi:MAG: DUF805 domain-containing protein [Alloprevotella sp.]|nr:DUF805 domain-containing protein [Bacteroidales bacterium]MDY4568533.1 DUF805 domain-containing protein [Alloprevotella sp.]